MLARIQGDRAAGYIHASGLQAKIVKRALEPVNEPMAADALALRLDLSTVRKVTNQNFNGLWQDDLETVGDEDPCGGDGLNIHRRRSSAISWGRYD